MTRYFGHCPQHPRIMDASADKLVLYHPFACPGVVDDHYNLTVMKRDESMCAP